MKIKVCGLKHPENIKAVAALKPDYMGFIYYDRTPRFINDLSADALDGLAPFKTGVFVDERKEVIDGLINQFGFDTIQLHGNESPEFSRYFKDRVKVIKAFGVDDSFDFSQLAAYADSVDYFMFDTKTVGYGGSGKTFNWQVLDNYTLNVPFFLSGGISADNLERIKEIKHPQFYAVDLNSRFEIEPGLKDIKKLEQAFKILRSQ